MAKDTYDDEDARSGDVTRSGSMYDLVAEMPPLQLGWLNMSGPGSEEKDGGSSYTISINEEQRAMIEACLEREVTHVHHAACENELQAEKIEELEILHSLFKELPDVEKTEPGIIHGFNL